MLYQQILIVFIYITYGFFLFFFNILHGKQNLPMPELPFLLIGKQ